MARVLGNTTRQSFNEEVIHKFNLTILEDEFNDAMQNERIHENSLSESDKIRRLFDCEWDKQEDIRILNAGSGQGDLGAVLSPKYCITNMDPCPSRSVGKDIVYGWCENIPFEDGLFDGIFCWGVIYFVRSLPETLIEFNRVLKPGGKLIIDVVKYSSMPLPQTTNPDCFWRYLEMYGFEMEERFPLGKPYFQREAFRFKKVRPFDPRRLRMPQSKGEILNFLEERDWFMK